MNISLGYDFGGFFALLLLLFLLRHKTEKGYIAPTK